MSLVFQSCEIVGMLPAEEAAIRRALYASLTEDKKPSPTKTKIKVEPPSDEEMDVQPAVEVEVETSDNELEVMPSTSLDISEDYIDVDALSSPELSESDQSTMDKGFGHSTESSYASSPQSYRSTNSLHLCLSSGSSSSSWLSFDSSSESSDSPSPWNSPASKRKPLPKASTGPAVSKSKRMLNFDGSNGTAPRGKKGKYSKMKGPAKGKARLQTAKKSAMQVAVPLPVEVECQARDVESEPRCSSVPKDSPYQAQRKFAANQPRPAR